MTELMRMLRLAGALFSGFRELMRGGRLRDYVRRLRTTYEMAQLNLYLCLPELRSGTRLRRTARRVVWNRLYNDVDFTGLDWEPFDASGIEHLHAALRARKGALVCTQHLGPYRRVFDELVRQGFPVSLLVAGHVARSIESQFRRRRRDDLAGRLRLLNAHQPGAGRDILAALARNEVVLVYLDGNTGVEGPGATERGAANTVVVPFFGRPVAVRRGVCQISYASGAAIVPLFARWGESGRPALECRAPLWPDRSLTMARFCEDGMRRLFAQCEAAIRERPEEFEEWPSVRRWRAAGPAGAEPAAPALVPAGLVERLLPAGPSAHARLRVDPQRARVLAVGGQHVLADGVHGRAWKAEPWLGEMVELLGRPVTVRELHRRLGRKYPGTALAHTAARLSLLGLLEEVPA